MRRAVIFLIAASFVCFMSWVAGFDFDKRGEYAFITAFVAVMFGCLAAAYPTDAP